MQDLHWAEPFDAAPWTHACNVARIASAAETVHHRRMSRNDASHSMKPICSFLCALVLISGARMAHAALPGSVTTSAARVQAERLSEVVDVREYGARCDGRTDDTGAFRSALTASLTVLARSNGGATLEIPAGRCLISQALTVMLGPNTALGIHGQGMYVSEILQVGGSDGLVFDFPETGSQDARTDAAPGQGVYVHDLSIVQADPQNRTIGRGIALIGPDPARYQVPATAELIDKVDFRSQLGTGTAGSAIVTTQNWASDIYDQDVSNVLVKDGQIIHYDFGRGSEKDIRIVSRSPAGKLSGNAVTGFVVSNENILAGHFAVSVEGNNIQSVSVLDTPMTAVGHAVSWDASGSGLGFNGPLVVRNSSISAQIDGIVTNGVNTLNIANNLIIDGQGISGTSWCGICADHTTASVVAANGLLNLPSVADLGPGFLGTGIRVGNEQGRYESVVSDNTIGTTDYGLVLAGPIGASNNIMRIDSKIPEHCYTDATVGGAHPTVVQNLCGGQRTDTAPNAPMMLHGDEHVTGRLAVAGGVLEGGGDAPRSSSAPCTTGQHAWDARYDYRCVSTNRWKRAALSDW